MAKRLERIRSSIAKDAYFELDLSDENFRQNALSEYVPDWARRKPFYAKRFGVPAAMICRASDFREFVCASDTFVMKVPDLPGYDAFDIFGGLESVLQMDGKRHSSVRRLMAPAFGPSGVEAIKVAVERIVADRLDIVEANGPEFDAIADFSDHLIMRSMLDATFELDEDQQLAFENAHKAMFAPNFKPGEERPPEYVATMDRVREVIHEVIDERRRNPRSDLISKLITAKDDDRRLSESELYGQINTICAGALGSTSSSLAAALNLLCKHPDQLEALKRNPELIDTAVNECLRMHGPGMFVFPRFAAEDTEIAGTPIYKDMLVIGSPQTANFDPDEFPDPTTFDVTRTTQPLTFGTGPHFCIGFRLAKLTMRTALLALLERFPDVRLADPDFTPVLRGNVGSLFITDLPMRLY